MRAQFSKLWSRHKLLLVSFLVSTAVVVFLAARLTVVTLYWSDPAHQEQTIEGWMPLRYVAHSWEVPPEILGDALDLERPVGRRRTIAQIAEEREATVQEIINTLDTAIATYRSDGDD
ncbi:hypothetical protein [Fodinicurvata sp. EGI_FJ10296]|uniref:hypothetical protein n=1 Tax=Fodinicurvata sp. EGI_FJ10296 TaxID=3231908 RepID=UPI00345589BF